LACFGTSEEEDECPSDVGFDGGILLQWTKPTQSSQPVLSYEITRVVGDMFLADDEVQPKVPLGTRPATATKFADNPAQAGTTYTYSLTVITGEGESTTKTTSFVTISTPGILIVDLGTSAPPARLAGKLMTPFDDTRECGGSVATVPSPLGGDLTFDAAMSHRTAATAVEPCQWSTWSHGYTGDVYFDNPEFDGDATTATMMLPSGTTAFYFYAEPNVFDEFIFTVTTSDGETFEASSGEVPIHGKGGARGFGFHAATTTIATITVTTSEGAGGFAVGEFAIASSPPEP
jgi:hypothetical protein